MKMKKGFLILSMLSIIGSNIDAATVTSLLDNGSAGTLRSVIASAPSGDTINFNVTGTIFLDEFLGELVVDKQLTIDGDNKITVDGQDQINICFHVTGVSASGSIIQNITIQNFNGVNVHSGSGTEPQELPAYGILIEFGAMNCSVLNTTIKNITANLNQAAGIRADEVVMIEVSGNRIDNVSGSGSIGIVVLILTGDCKNNAVKNVHAFSFGSGEGSGIASGIAIGSLNGDCIGNTVENLSSADSSFGIIIVMINSGSAANGLVECNAVLRVSGNGLEVRGLVVQEGDNLTIQGNVIDFIENAGEAAYGLLLGDNNDFVTNSLVSFNTISNIVGSNNDGFGISIENVNSTGNDLLNNSIFDINGKAINILNNGVPVDARVSLTSVRCADGCKLIVEGQLIQPIDAPQFKLQFFVSDSKNPEQAQTFIAERIIDTPQDLSFKLRLTGLPPVTFGQFITATATALPDGSEENNNTSEVSNALAACKPTGNFCPCAEVVLPEPPACPVTG